ncbi:MAG: hypothetical protein QM766_05580 [Burkholderiaceae bacterium]
MTNSSPPGDNPWSGTPHRRQYLIAPQQVRVPSGLSLSIHAMAGYHIYVGADLSLSTAVHGDTHIALLGEAIDAARPDRDNGAIADSLAHCTDAADLQACAFRLAGRFVVFARIQGHDICFADACGFRRLYYGRIAERLIATSSPRLYFDILGAPVEIDAETKKLMASQLFQTSEWAWYGASYFDPRLKILLPNHGLDLASGRASRLTRTIVPDSMPIDELVERAAKVLRGTFDGLQRRFRLTQAITAGWDSRLLLAASLPWKSDIDYFVFDEPRGRSIGMDARVALALGKRSDIVVARVERPDLDPAFVAAYDRNWVLPRHISTLRNIQYLARLPAADLPRLNVNGNAGEIGRCFFGAYGGPVWADMLLRYSGYGHESPVIERAIREWLADARAFARQQRISILDLFYWEQRMGNWGALGTAEMDIAIEQISPYDNGELLGLMLAAPASLRKGPRYQLFERICRVLAPELVEEPINPDDSRLMSRIRANAGLRYVTQAAQQTLRGLLSRSRAAREP